MTGIVPFIIIVVRLLHLTPAHQFAPYPGTSKELVLCFPPPSRLHSKVLLDCPEFIEMPTVLAVPNSSCEGVVRFTDPMERSRKRYDMTVAFINGNTPDQTRSLRNHEG